MVPFCFISHSKLYNDKNVIYDIKIKVKQVHGGNAVFLVVFPAFCSFSIFFNIKKVLREIVEA